MGFPPDVLPGARRSPAALARKLKSCRQAPSAHRLSTEAAQQHSYSIDQLLPVSKPRKKSSWNLVSGDYFKTGADATAYLVAIFRHRTSPAPDRSRSLQRILRRALFPATKSCGPPPSARLFDQPVPLDWLKAPQFNNSFEIVGVVAAARKQRSRSGAAVTPSFCRTHCTLTPWNVRVSARNLISLLYWAKSVIGCESWTQASPSLRQVHWSNR